MSEPSSAASAKPVAISFLTLEFVSTPSRSRSSATVASSSDRNMSRTASSRTAASGLDKREVRHGRPQRAPQAVVRADFGQAVRRGGAGILQRQRIDQIERDPPSADLTMKIF